MSPITIKPSDNTPAGDVELTVYASDHKTDASTGRSVTVEPSDGSGDTTLTVWEQPQAEVSDTGRTITTSDGLTLTVWSHEAGEDEDAAAYLDAVETADGTALPAAWRGAVNTFVKGCKADGIWDAIKASCILAGARTLSGALVPLVGPAPTNSNFVSGDYNRTTGLKGDGATKVLTTNRNNNADPQDSKHFAFYVAEVSANAAQAMGVGGSPGVSHCYLNASSTGGFVRCNGLTSFSVAAATPPVVRGASRFSSTEVSYFTGSGVTTGTGTSDSLVNAVMTVIGADSQFSAIRCSFYSIGEALDLALLDARLSTLMASAASIFDEDAWAYLHQVEAADGQLLESGVVSAVESFVAGCKSDGIWDAIKASCILAGARTLTGALIPLAGSAPTNNNFVSGDYNRVTGLVGDGSTKYLDSNRNNNADPQDDFHMGVYVTAYNDSAGVRGMGFGSGTTGRSTLGWNGASTTLNSRCRSNTLTDVDTSFGFAVGLNGISRSSSTAYTHRAGGTDYPVSVASDGLASGNIEVFRGSVDPTASRLSFYSVGESLDIALLDARLTTLMSSISSALS